MSDVVDIVNLLLRSPKGSCRYSGLFECKEKGKSSCGMQQVLATQRSSQSHVTSQPFACKHTASQPPLTQMSAPLHTTQASMGSHIQRIKSYYPVGQLHRTSLPAEPACQGGLARWNMVRPRRYDHGSKHCLFTEKQ